MASSRASEKLALSLELAALRQDISCEVETIYQEKFALRNYLARPFRRHPKAILLGTVGGWLGLNLLRRKALPTAALALVGLKAANTLLKNLRALRR